LTTSQILKAAKSLEKEKGKMWKNQDTVTGGSPQVCLQRCGGFNQYSFLNHFFSDLVEK
jgi:hypothetical protein